MKLQQYTMELLMLKGKIKFDFLTSASYNFSKNYISGSMLSFHFCSDSSICMYNLHLFSPLTTVLLSPSCLSLCWKISFLQENFAKYSMVSYFNQIFSWFWAQSYTVKVLLVPKCHYNGNCFRMESELRDLSMLQIKWTCFTATQWVKFLGAVLKSPFHLIQFSAASTCLASYQFTYIARIRHSFSQVNYTVFIPCNHEQAWLF